MKLTAKRVNENIVIPEYPREKWEDLAALLIREGNAEAGILEPQEFTMLGKLVDAIATVEGSGPFQIQTALVTEINRDDSVTHTLMVREDWLTDWILEPGNEGGLKGVVELSPREVELIEELEELYDSRTK